MCSDIIGGEIMAYGMMSSGMFGIGLVYFAIWAFLFSAIPWLTHNWLVNPKKKKR